MKLFKSTVTTKHSTVAAGEAKSSLCNAPCGDEWSLDIAWKYLRVSLKHMEMILCLLDASRMYFHSLTANALGDRSAAFWYQTRASITSNLATLTWRCTLRPAFSVLEVRTLHSYSKSSTLTATKLITHADDSRGSKPVYPRLCASSISVCLSPA